MKVLWITYGMFPEVLTRLSGKTAVKGSGGWLLGAAKTLSAQDEIELYIAIVNRQIKTRESYRGESIRYELIPFGKGFDSYHHGYDSTWRDITAKVKPDIVHVHGIESTLALSYLKACPEQKTVISIQGIAGVISRYYYEGLTTSDILRNITLRDILTRKPLFSYKKDFARRGKFENETLSLTKHVIGRTSWDKAHVWAVNPVCEYHFCNETLRDEFYDSAWSYTRCTPHTIFASQGTAPFKGIHYLLKALPLVRRVYPDTKIVIAGSTPVKGIEKMLYRTGYQKYLDKLIKKYGLIDAIEYTGALNAQEMVDAYLSCNVFVCPSTIENSSNSVAEAQILGVPLIASYVGGIPDMVPNYGCGTLVRAGETEMLAQAVCSMFENSQTIDNSAMRALALARHDKALNVEQTIEIYKEIIG